MNAQESDDPETGGNGAIGTDTHVRLGLVVSIIVMTITLVASSATAIWWAATVSTKLDSILGLYNTLNTASLQINQEINQLSKRIDRIELVGSPNLQSISTQVDKFTKEMEGVRALLNENTQRGCPKAIEVDRRLTAIEHTHSGFTEP